MIDGHFIHVLFTYESQRDHTLGLYLFQKLTVASVVIEVSAFYMTLSFIVVFTVFTCLWTL
jgi:hypothetical protein